MKNTFTINEIIDIYRAGIRRGADEASAYECGSYPNGGEYDELVAVMHEISNVGKQWDSPDYISYDIISEWFKK
jgi:hypothetical protein